MNNLPKNLFIFVPIYNDLDCFITLKSKIDKVLEENDSTKELNTTFILIDDTAGNDEKLKSVALGNSVRLITPPFNLGSQRALVYGIRMMRKRINPTDLIVTIDSDGEDLPEDIPKLISPLLSDKDNLRKISLARRTRRQESMQFRVLYFFYKILFVMLTGRLIRTGNFAAYRGYTAIKTIRHPHFDLCYSSSLVSLDLDLHFVPSPRGVRYAGHSKMNFQKLSMHGIRMLMPFLGQISIRALGAFSGSFALSMIFAGIILYVRIFTSEAIPGWATYTLLLLLIVSILSISQFILLFTMVSQSQGIALSDLENQIDEDID